MFPSLIERSSSSASRGRSALARAIAVSARALVATAAFGLGACRSDGAVAVVEPPPSHPLVGAYDFTARFTTFSFETIRTSPECTQSGPYCTVQRPAGDGSLTGVLVIGDSVIELPAGRTEFPEIGGTFTGRFCEVVDAAVPSGCSRTGASATLVYERGTLLASLPFSVDAPFFALLRGPGATGEGYVRLDAARIHADSLYGDVYWTTQIGRSPPMYRGTFVARRRGGAARD